MNTIYNVRARLLYDLINRIRCFLYSNKEREAAVCVKI